MMLVKGKRETLPKTTITTTAVGTKAQGHPPQPLLLPPKILECHSPCRSPAQF